MHVHVRYKVRIKFYKYFFETTNTVPVKETVFKWYNTSAARNKRATCRNLNIKQYTADNQ